MRMSQGLEIQALRAPDRLQKRFQALNEMDIGSGSLGDVPGIQSVGCPEKCEFFL